MMPKWCPNCATRLPEGAHGAQGFSDTEESDATGWDCFCEACYWSGDIIPDYATEAELATAERRRADG